MSEERPPYGEAFETRLAKKEFRLGVLFVHGIGTQPPRDTLVRWGDALLKVLSRAMAAEPGRIVPIVGRAEAGDRSGDKPAEVTVEFRCSDQDQNEKWLLAEGWWADSFPAPSYSELVSWTFRAAPWAIALHIAQRFWRTAGPEASRGAWLWAGTKAVAELLGAMALTPLFLVVMALTVVLGLLPIPQLRSLILSTQTMLIRTAGDCLAFVESPLRAALIRGRILEGLERLKGRCERTVIIAHSQGAAATLDALGGILDHDGMDASSKPTSQLPIPDALVTFGSGVNQLVSLKVLSAGRLGTKSGIDAASTAAMATLGMILLFILLFVTFRSEALNVGQLARAFVFLTGAGAVGGLIGGVFVLIRELLVILGVLKERAQDNKAKLNPWIMILASLASLALVGYYLREPGYSFDDYFRSLMELPTGPAFSLPLLLGFLAYSMWKILSPATQIAVTKPVRQPDGLARWLDLYASKDPVPNGATRIEGPSANLSSVKLWNRGSLISDHTTYWENLDGFVLRVARICTETADSPRQCKLPPARQSDWQDRCAVRRVRLLRWTIWFNRAVWIFVFCVLWKRYIDKVPTPFGLPEWFWPWGFTVERISLLAAFVALAAWATATLLRWRWRRWVLAEQEAAITSSTESSGWTDPFSGQGTVVVGLGIMTLGLTFDLEREVGAWLTDPKFWLLSPGSLFLFWSIGANFSSVVNWIVPKPRPPSP